MARNGNFGIKVLINIFSIYFLIIFCINKAYGGLNSKCLFILFYDCNHAIIRTICTSEFKKKFYGTMLWDMVTILFWYVMRYSYFLSSFNKFFLSFLIITR